MKHLLRSVVLLVPLLLPSPLLGQADAPEVATVRFVGNESFGDRALANAIVTRPTECRSSALLPFCWLGSDWAREPFRLDDRMLRRDEARVQLFYYQRGFREASVGSEVDRPEDGESVRVTFRIEEGRPVRIDSLSYEGLDAVSDTALLLDELPIGSGDPLSGIRIDATRDSLRSRLRNRGYAHAEVLRSYFIPRDDPYSGRVSYEIHPGPRATIGELTVVGNREVSETVVRRMLPFREGETYRQNLIFEAQRNLYNLEIFRHAEIGADLEHRPDSVVPLRIQVNEGDVHRVRAGAGWNNADCVNAESRWTSRNFFGGARRLQVRGRISNVLAPQLHDDVVCNEAGAGEFGKLNWRLSTDFNQPWIFSPRNSFSAGLYGERQSLKDIFVQNAVGATFSLSRQVGRRQSLSLSYEPQLSTLDAAEIFFCTSFLVCEPEDIDVLEGANWLSPLSVEYSLDRTNRLLDPSRGYSLQLELEHGSSLTGSDFAYNRAVAEISRYVPLGSGVVLGGHLRAGWTDPDAFGDLVEAEGIRVVHPQKRFFAGGSNSVRGYAQNRLGPKNLSVSVSKLVGDAGDGPLCAPEEIVDRTCDAGRLSDGEFTPRPTGGSQLLEGSVEIRTPAFGSRTQAVAFLDFGQVWERPGRFDPGDLLVTPGIGFRYYTPIGPIRVDLAYQLEAGERLQVVTSQLRPFDPDRDSPGDRLSGPDGEPLDYVRSDRLAVLQPRVLFDDASPLDLGRFQLHLSLGQAF